MINDLKRELKKHYEKKYQEGAANFFKEPIDSMGVRTPIVRKIARTKFKEVDQMTKKQVTDLCDSLLKTEKFELGLIAFAFIRRRMPDLDKADFQILESWVKKYVNNWAWCDDFCTHAIADMVDKYPELRSKMKIWTKSKNRWVRRASAVTFVHLGSQGKFHKDIFQIAKILLKDPDDLVQKGYGWMLKTAADHDQKAVFDFVMKNKDRMPRTALRYAIEKMPSNLKRQAMDK